MDYQDVDNEKLKRAKNRVEELKGLLYSSGHLYHNQFFHYCKYFNPCIK